jgi:hypothetical protein
MDAVTHIVGVVSFFGWGVLLGLYAWRSLKADSVPGIFLSLKRHDAPVLYWALSVLSLLGCLLCLGVAASEVFRMAVH